MPRNINRRQFVQTTAALGTGYWIADRAAAESKSPNEHIAFRVHRPGGQRARKKIRTTLPG